VSTGLAEVNRLQSERADLQYRLRYAADQWLRKSIEAQVLGIDARIEKALAVAAAVPVK
jgi:hypothetical protein